VKSIKALRMSAEMKAYLQLRPLKWLKKGHNCEVNALLAPFSKKFEERAKLLRFWIDSAVIRPC
jgi:hypothetical protein